MQSNVPQLYTHQGHLPQAPQWEALNVTTHRSHNHTKPPPATPPEHQLIRIERDEFAQNSREPENQDNEVKHPGALAAIHAGKSTRNLLAL